MPLPRPSDRVSGTPAAFVPPLELAVVIPTFNERDTVAPLIAALDVALSDRSWEAVFVDDGSTDGTPEAVERIAAGRRDIRLIRRVGRRGLSSAVVEGMLATVAPVVAAIDAAMRHDETMLPALHDAVLLDGADIAIGSRTGSAGDRDGRPMKASRLAHLVVRAEISDPLSGFFVVRRSVLLEAAPRLSLVGSTLLIDILASAPRRLAVAEVPYRARRMTGEGKRDSAEAPNYPMLLGGRLANRWFATRLRLAMAAGGVALAAYLLLAAAAGSSSADRAIPATIAIALAILVTLAGRQPLR